MSDPKHRLDVLSTGQTARLTGAAPRLRSRKGRFLVDQTRLGALQARALAEGGAIYSPWGDQHRETWWDVSGRGRDKCIAPRGIMLSSGEDEATLAGSAIELHVRCRECDPCRKAKSAFWKLRAMAEIGLSARTWFVTLTWRPEQRLMAEYRVGKVSSVPLERFRQLVPVLQVEVNRWLQRVRKGLRTEDEIPVSFRYLMVWEPHDSEKTDPHWRGFPHAHLLIFEQHGQQTLGENGERLSREWGAGFSKLKLVNQFSPDDIHKSAAYVCKYIAKSMLSRVRASLHFGGAAIQSSERK